MRSRKTGVCNRNLIMSKTEKTETFKPIKKLARDPNGNLSYEPFEANGHRYCFIRPGDPIGMEKWTEYQKLEVVAGVARTFEAIVRGYKTLHDVLISPKPYEERVTEAILLVDSFRKAILDMSAERVSKAFYLCSIFIYREGEDPYFWDMATAERNIQDWRQERIDPMDFFLLSMLLINGFSRIFQDLKKEADTQTERLWAVFGSKTAGSTNL